MKSKDLEKLLFNPYHCSNILLHFLSGVNSVTKNGIKTELINIVLPIIYNKSICEKLENLNKNSKFITLYKTREFQFFYPQINDYIKQYKEYTKNALLLLSSKEKITIKNYIIINERVNYRHEDDDNLKSIFKSSYNLGVLLAKEGYLACYLKMKITEL